MRTLHACIAGLALIAASSSTLASPRLPEGGIGDLIDVGTHEETDTDIFVIPMAVLEDSRCPIEVDCIQAGRLRVRVRVESRLGIEEHTIGLHSPVQAAGGILTMTSATPRSISPDKRKPYQFVFSFMANGQRR